MKEILKNQIALGTAQFSAFVLTVVDVRVPLEYEIFWVITTRQGSLSLCLTYIYYIFIYQTIWPK